MLPCSSLQYTLTPEGFVFRWIPEAFEEAHTAYDSQRGLLWQLYCEEKAYFRSDREVVVPHKVAVALDESERRILGLPPYYPYEIEIRGHGNLTDPDFKYVLAYADGSGKPLVNPKRIGSCLTIGDGLCYLLSESQYELVETLEQFNNRGPISGEREEVIKTNLLAFSKIKELATAAGATLDSHLRQQEVVCPSKIRLTLDKHEDGTLEVRPILCNDVGTGKPEGKAEAVLTEEEQARFLNVFDRFSSVRTVYPVPGGPRVVLPDKVRQTLESVKRYRWVRGEDKERLLRSPAELFDPDVVDLDEFSERVREIGEYRPQVFPFLRPAREPWLPPEGGIVLTGGELIPLTGREASELKQRVQEAAERGEEFVEFKNFKIPVSDEVVQVLTEIEELIPNEGATTEAAIRKLEGSRRKKHVLIIKDNFSLLEFRPEIKARPGHSFVPRSLKAGIRLLPHQSEGLKWLQGLWVQGAKGGLLADDMGLGKTLQALLFLAWVRELMEGGHYPIKPFLVVAPVALLENWQREYYEFFQELVFGPPVKLHGRELLYYKDPATAARLGVKKEIEIKDREDALEVLKSSRGFLLDHKRLQQAGLVLTTYETLRDYQFSFGLIEWAVIVLDEAQKIKTPTAMLTTAVKAMKYDFGLCLTGTPVENTLIDLWSIMDFVQPAWLGTLEEFRRSYYVPLSDSSRDVYALGQELKERIDGLMLRRTKEEELGGLPPKEVHHYREEMPEEQLKAYLDVIHAAKRRLSPGDVRGRKEHIFRVIAALRDVSLHPYLIRGDEFFLNRSDAEVISSSARLRKTVEILDEVALNNEKAIVFVVSRKLQRVLHRLILNRYGVNCAIINGEVSGTTRQKLVDQFQEAPGFNVIIMSPEAAGVGLNITAANHVIHLTRPWNPAKEDQATNRVYRIGQTKTVHVHIPMAVHRLLSGAGSGTFDEKLDRLLEEKRRLGFAVLVPSTTNEDELVKFGEELIGVTVDETLSAARSGMEQFIFANLTQEELVRVARIFAERQGLVVDTVSTKMDLVKLPLVVARADDDSIAAFYCRELGPAGRRESLQAVLEARSVGDRLEKLLGGKVNMHLLTNADEVDADVREAAKAHGVTIYSAKDLAVFAERLHVTWGEMSLAGAGS